MGLAFGKNKNLRDSQKGKVYRSEGVLRKFATSLPSVFDVEKFCDKVTSSCWTQKHFGPRNKVVVKDGRGTRNAFARSWMINIPLWARSSDIVLHELAHVFVQRKPPHGPLFAAAYLKLVKHFMGKEAHTALKQAFRKNRVKTKIRAKRILTNEQKEILRERMVKARAAKITKSSLTMSNF